MCQPATSSAPERRHWWHWLFPTPLMPRPKPAVFDPVESVIADIRIGRMVIVTDDEDRENEGDLICAAEKITPEIGRAHV